MKSIITIAILGWLLIFSYAKSVQKTIKLTDFSSLGPFIFVSKLQISQGQGQMDISYRKHGHGPSQLYDGFSIGVLNQQLYSTFCQKSNCRQKQQLLFKSQKLSVGKERQGMKHIKLLELQNSTEWYFYLFCCQCNRQQMADSSEEINLVFSVTNNGSHFGANDYFLLAYLLFVVVWVIIVIGFGSTMAALISEFYPNLIKLMAFGGLVLMGVAYMYEVIHLYIYYSDGSGVPLFHILYLVLRGFSEIVITAMLVAVAWGWSVIHTRTSMFYQTVGGIYGLINVIFVVLSYLAEENQMINHPYETTPGQIILLFRIVVTMVFLGVLADSFRNSSGKIIFFLRKLGLVGGLYTLCLPTTVLLVELTLPAITHQLVITLVVQLVHIYASAALCYMLTEPESAYRRVSLLEDDNPLRIRDYKNK